MNNNTPTLSRALSPLIALVLFAALIPATAASAASPEELTDRCITRMMNVSQRAVEGINTAADKGVEKIVRLDENDRPALMMVRAANKMNIAIEKREIKSDRKVNKTADKCLRVLANIENADPALADMVNSARLDAISAIHAASIDAHIKVNDALEAALEDEEPSAEE